MSETLKSLTAKLGLKTEEDVSRFIAGLAENHPEISLERAFRLACEDKKIALVDTDGALFRALCGYRPTAPCAVGH